MILAPNTVGLGYMTCSSELAGALEAKKRESSPMFPKHRFTNDNIHVVNISLFSPCACSLWKARFCPTQSFGHLLTGILRLIDIACTTAS